MGRQLPGRVRENRQTGAGVVGFSNTGVGRRENREVGHEVKKPLEMVGLGKAK